ncbi:hypothetical protein [Chryseobacterium glaciei]|uniref:hypothetical protein n=1 Tax=Chryseobacterium glaciei TaxID=1685010 RepID=UPI001E41FD91|nr:hypothetical protein [Chryseobacterium glaciei]
MKKFYSSVLLFMTVLIFGQISYTITPNPFNDPNGLITRIYVYNNTASTVQNVVVIANYDTSEKDVVPYFPYTGQWKNLLDNNSINSFFYNSSH